MPALLEAGFMVCAFGRDLHRLEASHVQLQRLEGDMRNPAEMDRALTGAYAVVWLARARPQEAAPVDHRVMAFLLRAMIQHRVPRFLTALTLGIHPDDYRRLPWAHRLLASRTRRELREEHGRLERAVGSRAGRVHCSILYTWTLRNGPPTPAWRATELEGENWRVRGLCLALRRADLAMALVQELARREEGPTRRLAVLPRDGMLLS